MRKTGKERDSETNLDHTWFRQYSSQLGRWMHPDPAGLAAVEPTNPQSWNRYAYVTNNPLRYTDPAGRDLVDDLWGGGGGGGGGPCFMCGTYNINYYIAMSDLKFYGLAYYQIPGHSGFGSNGAEEEARYVSIMKTGWDPELGRWEWNWHSLESDLHLAAANPTCANLAGGADAVSNFLTNVPIESAGDVIPQVQQAGPGIADPLSDSSMAYFKLLGALTSVKEGLFGLPSVLAGWPGGTAMAVGPVFSGFSTGQQMSVVIHEAMHFNNPNDAARIDSMIRAGTIEAACGTSAPPIPQGVVF